MGFDSNYLILVLLPSLLLSGLAQAYVRSAYSRWGQTRNGVGLPGSTVAQRILQKSGLRVDLQLTPQELGDHFDPTSQTVRFSPGVAGQPSVASMAIVAHELGHVQQYAERSALIAARGFLVPAVRVAPMLSYGLIIAGLMIGLAELAWLGIIVFGITVLFMLLTLPVELDASRRAMVLLEENGLLVSQTDRDGARQMLTAAALTYVAAAVTAVLQLLYYISLVSRSRRR